MSVKPGCKTIGGLIQNELAKEIVGGKNKVQCLNCDITGNTKTTVTKQLSILNYPRYWIICLKMFENNGNKITRVITSPLHFKLQHVSFVLISAVIHEGHTQHRGHYIEIGRSVNDCIQAWINKGKKNPKWAEYGAWTYSNDSRKYPTTVGRVKTLLGCYGRRRNINNTKCAYILLYKSFEVDEIQINNSIITIPTNMPIISLPNPQQPLGNDNIPSKTQTTTKNDSFQCSMLWNCPQCNQCVEFMNKCPQCKMYRNDADSIGKQLNASYSEIKDDNNHQHVDETMSDNNAEMKEHNQIQNEMNIVEANSNDEEEQDQMMNENSDINVNQIHTDCDGDQQIQTDNNDTIVDVSMIQVSTGLTQQFQDIEMNLPVL